MIIPGSSGPGTRRIRRRHRASIRLFHPDAVAEHPPDDRAPAAVLLRHPGPLLPARVNRGEFCPAAIGTIALVQAKVPGLPDHQADDFDLAPVPGRRGRGNARRIDLGDPSYTVRARGAGRDKARGGRHGHARKSATREKLARYVGQFCTSGTMTIAVYQASRHYATGAELTGPEWVGSGHRAACHEFVILSR